MPLDRCLEFYKGRRVLVTGHTGFKGAWLCRILQLLGAEVTGYALQPPTSPSLFELAHIAEGMHSVTGDVRDLPALRATLQACRPEVVFHLAAQPIVREGYRDPHGTFESNVMGTVNLLECLREVSEPCSALVVTTDKVYENATCDRPLCEGDRLGGVDPYSASKSCAELAVRSYRAGILPSHVTLSTARAGNVIGGGDFAKDRILPDCVRAYLSGEALVLRNPHAVRPYQHVLEPLFAYLTIAARQAADPSLAGEYNVGPLASDCCSTEALVSLFEKACGVRMAVLADAAPGPCEAQCLRLDSSRIGRVFGWSPTWTVETAVQKSVEWTLAFEKGEDVLCVMDKQIQEFINT